MHMGRMVFSLADIERGADLCFRQLIATDESDVLTPLVTKLALKQKLDTSFHRVPRRFADVPGCIDEFARWHGQADRMRVRRNDLVHGCWHAASERLELSVSSRGALARHAGERAYNVAMLCREAKWAERLRDTFGLWREQWMARGPG
jgi:hypothetical protein